MEDNSNLKGESQPVNPQPASQPAMGVIYKITNTLNGKIYVGKTKRKLERRIYEHNHNASKGTSAVEVAIAKYGWENFTVEVVETCPVEKLNEREKFWIVELDSKSPHGYNETDGGEGLVNPSAETRARMSASRPDVSGEKNPNYGKKTPPEVCAKISASNKGKTKGKKRKPLSEEHKAKVSANHADVSGEKNPNYGKKTPPEVCAKISASNKGKPSPNKGKKTPPEVCAKISASRKGQPSPRKGKKHTPESIAKMSASKKGKKGRPHTPEEIAKISAANKGKPSPLKGKTRPPEVCARIAAGQKARWAKKKAVENGGNK